MLYRIGLPSFGSQQPHFGGLCRLIPALDAGLSVRARASAPPQRGSADHKVGTTHCRKATCRRTVSRQPKKYALRVTPTPPTRVQCSGGPSAPTHCRPAPRNSRAAAALSRTVAGEVARGFSCGACGSRYVIGADFFDTNNVTTYPWLTVPVGHRW